MPDPFLVGPSKPLPDDPVANFASMNQAIDETLQPLPVGEPILPCQKPYVEIWLLDSKLSAVPAASCSIRLPSGKSNGGELDENGYLKIEDFDIGDDEMDDTFAVALEAAMGGSVSLRISGDPLEDGTDEDEEDAVTKAPPIYWKEPFDEEDGID